MTDPELARAARRAAINLMRLNEALEMRDAEYYSTEDKRKDRQLVLQRHYRQWFSNLSKGFNEPE